MITSTDQIQILYEIALTTGEGKNLKQAANKALSVYLRKLNCFAGAIYQKEQIENLCWYKKVNAIPSRIERIGAFKNLLGGLPLDPENCSKGINPEALPGIGTFDENTHTYIMNLPGYGFLAMLKKGEMLPDDFILSLKPLNKKLADALRAFTVENTLNLHSAALEASSNAILITDVQGYIRWVNEAWCSLNGFTREEVLGKYSNLVKSDDHEAGFYKKMWDTLALGKTWNGEITNRKKDGEKYIAEINITPVFDNNNQITHFIGISQDVTEKRLAEERLKDNEAMLSTLVETIPDLVWLKDAEGTYLACNPKFEKFFGATEKEIIGKTDYDFVDKNTGDLFRQHDKNAMDAGKPTVNEEEVTYASDGHKELLETIKTPMFDADKNVIGVLGIARDITGRKLTEEALIESKERFEQMANLLPQPIWEVSAGGRFVYANKAGYEIFGYTPEDINKGLNFLKVISKKDHKRIMSNFSKKIRGIKTDEYEYECIKQNGETFPAMIYTSPINKHGKIIGVRGITLDISNMKNAQEELRYFSALQDILINVSTKYINVSTEKIDEALREALTEMGEFVSADRAYIFEYDFKKQITNNTHEWCYDGIKPEIENLQGVPLEALPQWTDKHLKGDTVYVPDVLALDPENDLRKILEPQGIKSLIAVPMMHGSECLGFIGFDSVRKHHSYSEKEKSILQVFAQIVVNFQLRSKAEQELIHAKETAEQAEKAQFNFLSTMSHEIRTPLNAVVGITNILLMENPKPGQITNLKTLKFSSQNLLSIINDILDFNKLVSGKVVLEQADFSIQEILKGMHYAMNSLAKAKEISLDYTVDKDIPEIIVGDSTRLLQIINNLVSNAIKFTKQGGVKVDVNLISKKQKKVTLHVSVKDTGIGIPRDKFETVFEEFKQTSSSTTREYGGTGLGLPIVKKLLEAMGSEIVLQSEVGKGSEFSFDIDFLIGDRQKIKSSDEPVTFDDSLKGIRVLLVEDNKINQMVARKFLSEWKTETDIADNGKIALEKLDQSNYDVVLMDLQMPVMDGYTATEEIRKHSEERISKIPVIALSASALGEIETRARKYGMDDFVTKPFVPEVLFSSMVKAVKR